MSAEAPAFVDTNVLVYAFDESDPRRQAIAEALVSRLVDEDRLRLSTQVFQEFYVTMTRKIARPMSPADTLALMDDLAQWPCIEVDYAIVREAALLSAEAVLSFWDALIVVAAKRSAAEKLFTEDLNHGQRIHGVQVENPFRTLA